MDNIDNIYLCGFMGCNKIAIGKRIARLLKRRFLSLDDYIEKKLRSPICLYCTKWGEESFHRIERLAFEEVACMKNAVVVVGGTAFSYEQNIINAKNSGVIFYLYVPFQDCYKRIVNDSRVPITSGRTNDQLLDIYHKRHTIFKISANYTIPVIHSTDFIARQICKLEDEIHVKTTAGIPITQKN